jgi:hypothetical protein
MATTKKKSAAVAATAAPATGTFEFPCGCQWPVIGPPSYPGGPPLLKMDHDRMPFCAAVRDLFANGRTKGVFQLEEYLGQKWSKELRPESVEHLCALVALLRPGCVSGDTKIAVRLYDWQHRGLRNITYIKARDLYARYKRQHHLGEGNILCLDESTNRMVATKIQHVTYTGEKPVYRPVITAGPSGRRTGSTYTLECTDDHPLLTLDRGWVPFKEVIIGERVAVLNRRCPGKPSPKTGGSTSYQTRCWHHYRYRCVMCDWSEGSLDVNHLRGKRRLDNRPENLCFLCPNHHRMYTLGTLMEEEVVSKRASLHIPHTEHVMWGTFSGSDSVGVKDTYDIGVVGANNNFLAGNVFVHNCLKAVDESGVSMTEHYVRRRHGQEEVPSVHPAVDAVLKDNYGICCYQEDIIRLSETVAGFSKTKADELRKGCAKKLPELMAKLKVEFLDGAKVSGVVPLEIAEALFQNIEKSASYAFNRSHSYSYATIAFQTAYMKAHLPAAFFANWMKFAHLKQKKKGQDDEICLLVEDAKTFGLRVLPPDVFRGNASPVIADEATIVAGLTDVASVNPATVKKLLKGGSALGPNPTWTAYLLKVLALLPAAPATNLILAGATRSLPVSRRRQAHELATVDRLKKKATVFAWMLEHLAPDDTLDSLIERAARPKKEGGACATGAQVEDLLTEARLLRRPPASDVDTPRTVCDGEMRALGVALTYGRLDGCDLTGRTATCQGVKDGAAPPVARVALYVRQARVFKTKPKRGSPRDMAYLTAGDETATLNDLLVFPDAYAAHRHLLREGNVVLAEIEPSRKGSGQVVVKAWQL